ncbi:TPA: hypothetical protein ACKP8M_001359 [Stenotrophomonas maltophilia]
MREKIAAWKNALDGDANSVSQALSHLAWNIAAFSSIGEAIREAPETEGAKKINGMMIDLLVEGFWGSTMQAIRRLVDKAHPLYGRNGVCSLGAILSDVRAVRNRITRRVYVEQIAELPYNYEEVRRRHEEYAWQQGPGAFWVPREFHYEISEQRHAEFDWLSGTTPGTSSDADVIQESIFDRLDARLARLDGVVEHATLHYAHAATEASRNGRVLDQWGLDDAKAALKELYEVAELIGRWFCFSGVGMLLPTPQFDQFEHLDQPLLQGSRASLDALWNAFDEETQRWYQINNEDL